MIGHLPVFICFPTDNFNLACFWWRSYELLAFFASESNQAGRKGFCRWFPEQETLKEHMGVETFPWALT